jgi:hypothetical protein
MPSKRVSVKGKGAELFFGDLAEPVPSPPELPEPAASTVPPVEPKAEPPGEALAPVGDPAPAAATRPRRSPSSRRHASAPAPADAAAKKESAAEPLDETATMELIGAIIKHPGREVSFVRLSPEEKARIADTVYAFKRQGLKVTETELHRIGLNYLLADYDQRGEASLLARLLARLKA